MAYGPPQIFPPLPINEPGSTSPGPVAAPVTQSGTGLSFFNSPPTIQVGLAEEIVIPGETPPNTQQLFVGPITENVEPSLSPVLPGLSNVSIASYPQTPPPGPAIALISPSSGTSAGGVAFTITGAQFIPGAVVTIGGFQATNVVVVNSTTITGLTPATPSSPIALSVTVTTLGGSATLMGGYTSVLPAPTVLTITPNLGDASGGVAVTITGTGFIIGATTVTIGGVAATSVVVSSPTTLTAVTPALAASLVPVAVAATTALGTGTLPAAYTSFLPTLIAGIAAWYRADLGITIATGVSAWTDQSGNGDSNRNALQGMASKQPTLNASDALYNNQKTLSFAGASAQELQTGVWSVPLAQPFTMMAIGNSSGASRAETFISSIDAGAFILVEQNWNSTSHYEIFAGSFGDSTIPFSASPIVFGAIFNGASSKTYISTNTPTATVSIGANGANGLTLGADEDGTSFPLYGKIAETMVWSRVLTGGEIIQLNTYAKGRYGIPIGP